MSQENKSLLEDKKRLRLFLSNMSHELRTPLNSIKGFAQMIESDIAGKTTKKQQQYIKEVVNSSDYSLKLINSLLYQSNKQKMTIGIIEADRFLKQIICSVDSLLNDKKLKIDLINNAGIVNIYADELQLQQAILNLIVNAIQWTPHASTITLDVINTENTVTISVIDQGPGIPKEKATQIFKPFEQLSIGYSKTNKGVGLGLSIVKTIAEKHNGNVYLDISNTNGAKFDFVIPSSVSIDSTLDEKSANEKASLAPSGI